MPKYYCMVGFFNYYGDARVKGYAKWLTQRGDYVDVICAHNFPKDEVVYEDGVRVFIIATKFSRHNKLSYLLEYANSYFKLTLLLTRQFFKQRYHLIHFHNIPDFLVFAGLIPRVFGSKMILDIHDPMPEAYKSKFPNKESGLEMKVICFEEKISCWFVNAVITANQHFVNNLTKRGIPAEKITLVRNYPDTEYFNQSKRVDRSSSQSDHYVLIFPGTIAPRYGLNVAVKAMPAILEKIPNAQLLLIGMPGEYSEQLKDLANQLDCVNNVVMLPSVPNSEIPKFLKQADLGIYPALPDPHMSIAIPGKLLEFVIMGLPIISSRLQIVEEMFDDKAIAFFEPGNHEEFASQVLSLYSDPKRCKEMVQKADQILAENFSQDMEVNTYFDLLEKLSHNEKKR